MSNEMVRVGLAGGLASGKTTVARHIAEMFDVPMVSFGDPVREIANLWPQASAGELPKGELLSRTLAHAAEVLPGSTDEYGFLHDQTMLASGWAVDLAESETWREAAQRIGTETGRRVRTDIWLDCLERRLGDLPAVCDSLRFANEHDRLKDLGFVTIRVNVSLEERKRRLYDRDGEIPDALYSHASEAEIDDLPVDYEVDGEKPVKYVLAEVEGIEERIRRREAVKNSATRTCRGPDGFL